MAETIKRNEDFLGSIQEGRRKMLSENFALIGETQMVQTWSQTERCSIEQIGEKLITIFHGIGMKKS